MTDRFVKAAELASTLGCSTRTVYRMTHEGEIPAIKLGREYRYDVEAVVAKLAEPAPAWRQSRRSTSRRRVT